MSWSLHMHNLRSSDSCPPSLWSSWFPHPKAWERALQSQQLGWEGCWAVGHWVPACGKEPAVGSTGCHQGAGCWPSPHLLLPGCCESTKLLQAAPFLSRARERTPRGTRLAAGHWKPFVSGTKAGNVLKRGLWRGAWEKWTLLLLQRGRENSLWGTSERKYPLPFSTGVASDGQSNNSKGTSVPNRHTGA